MESRRVLTEWGIHHKSSGAVSELLCSVFVMLNVLSAASKGRERAFTQRITNFSSNLDFAFQGESYSLLIPNCERFLLFCFSVNAFIWLFTSTGFHFIMFQ